MSEVRLILQPSAIFILTLFVQAPNAKRQKLVENETRISNQITEASPSLSEMSSRPVMVLSQMQLQLYTSCLRKLSADFKTKANECESLIGKMEAETNRRELQNLNSGFAPNKDKEIRADQIMTALHSTIGDSDWVDAFPAASHSLQSLGFNIAFISNCQYLAKFTSRLDNLPEEQQFDAELIMEDLKKKADEKQLH